MANTTTTTATTTPTQRRKSCGFCMNSRKKTKIKSRTDVSLPSIEQKKKEKRKTLIFYGLLQVV